MEVSNFFSRLLQAPKESVRTRPPDDIADFDAAWTAIRDTLEHPDERQLVRGIAATDVPQHLKHIVDALVYEGNRTDEDTTGACLEYFLRNDLLAILELLCESDRPHGIKADVVKSINNLVVLLSERFLVHNAVHRPLRRLLRSCVGEAEAETDGGEGAGSISAGMVVVGQKKLMGAAGMVRDLSQVDDELEADLVDLMCILCSRMRAYPPLLLIFFHDKGWLVPNPRSSTATPSDPSRALSPTPSKLTTASSNAATQRSSGQHHFEFLVFSYLLRFVHREGRTGDFARAGLLFLFDIAFLTPQDEGGDNLAMPATPGGGPDPLQDARDALGEYVLDGDFPEVMAAGLGAIYSLLPTKLHVPGISEQVKADAASASVSGGMHLGDAPVDPAVSEPRSIRSASEPEVRSQLDLFLKLFGFLQDILHRCSSPLAQADPNVEQVNTAHVLGPAISDATLDAIETSFIDGVLYPSILECSPVDGSAVAVLTYLDVLVSHLDDGPLLRRILAVLMDTKDADPHGPARKRANSNDFLTQATREGGGGYYDDSGKFTLKDLVLDSLRSSNPASSVAALKLVDTLLAKHCSHATSGLISIVEDPSATSFARRPLPLDDDDDDDDERILTPAVNSTNVHLQEVELYGSLLSRLDQGQTTVERSQGYATYLADMQASLRAEECFQPIPLQFVSTANENFVHVGEYESDPRQHRMSPSDPLVRAVLAALGGFFQRTADENVALTGVITSLALCANRSLAGWMLYDVKPESDPWSKRKATGAPIDFDDGASDQSLGEDLDKAVKNGDESDPFSARASVDLPAIYQILRDLVRQVARFRAEVDEFDRLVGERRQGLLFADHLDEAMNINLEIESSPYPRASTLASPGSLAPPGSPVARGAGGGKSPARPSVTSSLRSFLTPRKRGMSTSPAQVVASGGSMSTPSSLLRAELAARSGSPDLAPPSPFKAHYDEAAATSLYAQSVSPVASGPWSPARTPLRPGSAAATARRTIEINDGMFGAGNGAPGEEREGPKQVSVSEVLDNCVVLEEFIKEVVSVIMARRALGIDQVGFV